MGIGNSYVAGRLRRTDTKENRATYLWFLQEEERFPILLVDFQTSKPILVQDHLYLAESCQKEDTRRSARKSVPGLSKDPANSYIRCDTVQPKLQISAFMPHWEVRTASGARKTNGQ